MLQYQSVFIMKNEKKLWSKANINLLSSIGTSQQQNMEFKYDGKQGQFAFSLFDCYLVKHKSQNKLRWINMNNVIMKQVNEEQLGEGITFNKNGLIFEIYGEIKEWFQHLKRYCIQTNFQKKFKLIKKIGNGKFGQVYQCQERSTKLQYAVKCFQKQCQDDEDKQAIVKEIMILRKLHHKQIIHLYEVYECEDNIYLILELFKGGDLQEYISIHHPILERDAALITYRVISALFYIHSLGIMHRDIKPENIILKVQDEIDQIYLVDFGLADFYNSQGKYLYTRCGTPGFVAPEILQDKNYDFKVDMFSVGILLFYMVTCKLPFQDTDYDKVVILNYRGKVDLTQVKMSELGIKFLQELLSVKPKDRMTAEEALNHPWYIQQGISISKQSRQSTQCTTDQRKHNTPMNKYLLNFTKLHHNSNINQLQQPGSSENSSQGNAETPLISPMQSPRPHKVIKKSNFLMKNAIIQEQARNILQIPKEGNQRRNSMQVKESDKSELIQQSNKQLTPRQSPRSFSKSPQLTPQKNNSTGIQQQDSKIMSSLNKNEQLQWKNQQESNQLKQNLLKSPRLPPRPIYRKSLQSPLNL